MEYHLQSMYNHKVGRAASAVSPFFFILLGKSRTSDKALDKSVFLNQEERKKSVASLQPDGVNV